MSTHSENPNLAHSFSNDELIQVSEESLAKAESYIEEEEGAANKFKEGQ